MKKLTILRNPTRINDVAFDDLDDASSDTWQLKAERLIQRREKKLRLRNA